MLLTLTWANANNLRPVRLGQDGRANSPNLWGRATPAAGGLGRPVAQAGQGLQTWARLRASSQRGLRGHTSRNDRWPLQSRAPTTPAVVSRSTTVNEPPSP